MATFSSVAYPVGGTTVSGNTVTMQQYADQPTRVTNYLSNIQLRGYISPLVFAPAGGVSGGAVVYDQLSMNDLFGTRRVQKVEPGAEFPIVTSDYSGPKMAKVSKFGGKFFATDEAMRRNDTGLIRNEGQKLMNDMVRTQDEDAVALLASVFTDFPSQVITGHSWSSVVTGGSSQTNNSGWPAADLAAAQLLADTQELSVAFNLWLVNPQQLMQFNMVYGAQADAVRQSLGVRMVASNRIAAGTAYALEAGRPGEVRYETPIKTESWREQTTQRQWWQTDVSLVMYITNPYSIVKVTGLA